MRVALLIDGWRQCIALLPWQCQIPDQDSPSHKPTSHSYQEAWLGALCCLSHQLKPNIELYKDYLQS